MTAAPAPTTRLVASRRQPLAAGLVQALEQRIRDGRYPVGEKLPTEAALAEEFGVSRTVVREALSRLQVAGWVQTRHGIGTFAAEGDALAEKADAAVFRVRPDQLGTLQEVIAVLELRIGVETEAASLAAQRRVPADVQRLRQALAEFSAAVDAGRDAVAADLAFHQAVAGATRNAHFTGLLAALGPGAIPRARLQGDDPPSDEQRQYLRRINQEHASIVDAIEAGDAEAARAAMRTHLANSKERRRRAARHA